MTAYEYSMAKADAMTRLVHPSDKRGVDTRAFYAKAAEGFAERAGSMTVEEDGTAVGSDGCRMAWTELDFAPPTPLWIPAQLIKSARNSVFVEWTPGAQWAHGAADMLVMPMRPY